MEELLVYSTLKAIYPRAVGLFSVGDGSLDMTLRNTMAAVTEQTLIYAFDPNNRIASQRLLDHANVKIINRALSEITNSDVDVLLELVVIVDATEDFQRTFERILPLMAPHAVVLLHDGRRQMNFSHPEFHVLEFRSSHGMVMAQRYQPMTINPAKPSSE